MEGFRLEDLSKNEQFVSATLQATQVALRTHSKEKLEALKSAALNVALGKEVREDLHTIFLGLVDRFAPSHITLLRPFTVPRLIGGTGAY